jgi:hypothetical protein
MHLDLASMATFVLVKDSPLDLVSQSLADKHINIFPELLNLKDGRMLIVTSTFLLSLYRGKGSRLPTLIKNIAQDMTTFHSLSLNFTLLTLPPKHPF